MKNSRIYRRRSSVRLGYVFSILCFVFFSNAFAAWTTNGPQGISIRDVKVDPNDGRTVYAVGLNAVYKSINKGESFTAYSQGIVVNEWLYALAVHPIFSNIVYVGGRHFYRSMNGGQTWQEIGNGLPVQTNTSMPGVTDILIDPATPNIMYVSNYVLVAADTQYGGVYKSTDGGENFVDITPDDEISFRVASLTMDAVDHNIIYAGLWGSLIAGGVWKSTNGGTTWIENTTMSPEHTIYSVKADPRMPGRLYAGGLWSGCWLSENYGETWQVVVPTQGGYSDIAVHRATVFYACEGSGLYRSTNSGVSWIHLENDIPNSGIYEVSASQTTSGLVFVGGALWLNLYKSLDNGENFTRTSNGFPQVNITCVAAPTIPTKTVYSGSPWGIGGIFKTENNGTDWFQTMFPTFPVVEVAVCPNNPDIVLGALEDVFIGSPGAYTFVHQSTDGAEHFSFVMGGLPGVSEIAFDPTNTSIVYVAIPNEMPPHFYRSTNYGASFTPIYDQGIGMKYVRSLVVEDANTFYVGTSNYGVYKSTNGGYNWFAVNNGIPAGTDVNSLSKCFLIPGQGIVAGTENGVYRTTDGGANWYAVGTLPYNINDVFSGNRVTIVGHVGMVAPILWAATNNGVFEYVNGAWYPRNEGLDTLVVKELTMTIPGETDNFGDTGNQQTLPLPQYSVIHAATPCGTYEYVLGASTPGYNTQGNDRNESIMDIGLQVFPSLINDGHADVEFTLPEPTQVDLLVYDMAGRLCRTIISNALCQGHHKIPVTIDLPAGSYFYNLKTGSGINIIRKAIWVK